MLMSDVAQLDALADTFSRVVGVLGLHKFCQARDRVRVGFVALALGSDERNQSHHNLSHFLLCLDQLEVRDGASYNFSLNKTCRQHLCDLALRVIDSLLDLLAITLKWLQNMFVHYLSKLRICCQILPLLINHV